MDNLRRFFLTASIIIFISLCIGGFITALNYDPKEVQLEPGNPTPLPAVGDIYNPEKYQLEDLYKDNVLFILTPKEDKSAVDFLISKYNPQTQDLNFLIVPDDLKVVNHENKKQICTLGEYFKSQKGSRVADYLTSLLQIDIAGYCTFTYKDLTSFIKTFGAVKCTLPYGIKFISSDSDNITYSTGINYSSGEVTLSGDSAVNLINFIEDDYAALDGEIIEYYDGYYNENYAKEIHSAMSDDFVYIFINGFINKFTPDYQEKINDGFSKLKETSDSNITDSMLKGMTYKLCEINKDKVNFYRLTGTPVYNNNFYITYNNEILNIKSGERKAATEILDLAFS